MMGRSCGTLHETNDVERKRIIRQYGYKRGQNWEVFREVEVKGEGGGCINGRDIEEVERPASLMGKWILYKWKA